MSLLDALLLDAQRINLWFAVRTDGNRGSGTEVDPYNSQRFDQIMSGLPSSPPIRVHLGPGQFLTNGYADGVTGVGWQPKPGMKIVGSGIDVTTLKLTGAQNPPSGTRHYWAVGHLLDTGGSLMNYFEISDLTIDCNLGAQSGSSFAIGAVRVMGHHSEVRRVKVIHWGTKTGQQPCLVVGMITADPTWTTEQIRHTGIEDCIAVDPHTTIPANAEVTVLHVGPKGPVGAAQEGAGVKPFIRHCSVDGGALASFLDPDIRALSMGWCKDGWVEGNAIRRVRVGGPYLEGASAHGLTVRDNSYYNVRRGPYFKLGTLSSSLGTGSLWRSGGLVTATGVTNHGLAVGDRVQITAANTTFDGVFEVTAVASAGDFQYADSRADGSSTASSVKRVYGVGALVVEANTIELAKNQEGERAIHVDDNDPDPPSPQTPDYVHGEVVIRHNRIRYVDGELDSSFAGEGILVRGVKNLTVESNVLEVAQADPIGSQRTGSIIHFDNRTPGGALLPHLDPDTGQAVEELDAAAEDALVLSLYGKP